ncbi:MAG: ArsR/SmtB family transcription factor [Chloroflexota bacterium]
MPAPQQSLIIGAPTSTLSVALEPAHNAFNSLAILAKSRHLSGLGDWVNNTLEAMSNEELERHYSLFTGFYFAVQPQKGWPSFPAYLDYLDSLPPQALVDRLLEAYAELPKMKNKGSHEGGKPPRTINREAILSSLDSYLEFLYSIFSKEYIDEQIEAEAYRLMGDPLALQQLLVSHLRHMWDRYLREEWERVRPMLQSAVDAFAEVDLSGMSRLEAANFVTGRDLEELKWNDILQRAEEVIFVPSTHVGPYLGRFWHEGTLRIIFGARLPAGTQVKAPDLSRADIVVRLNALADDTRLRILKLVADEGEMRTQEIMDRLDLSQSATSRHLKQLSAANYLSERRCAGAKCYRLNEARVEDTLQAVGSFLLGQGS